MKKLLLILLSFFLVGFVYADDDIIEEPVVEEIDNDFINAQDKICEIIDVSSLTFTMTNDEYGYYIKFDNLDSLLPSTGTIKGYYSMIGELYDGYTIFLEIAGGGFRWNDLHDLYKSSGKWTAFLPSSWVTEDGYDDITLSFGVGDSCYYANKSIKVPKPGVTTPDIRNRYDVKFYDSRKHINIVGKSIYAADNLLVEIGAIRDLELLDDLKNNVSGAYDSLLTYAKNNTGSNLNYKNAYNRDDSYSTYNMGFTKNVVYYLYISHKDYLNTDGIMVVQGVSNFLLTTDVNFNNMVNTTSTSNPELMSFFGDATDACFDVDIGTKIDYQFGRYDGKYYLAFYGTKNVLPGKNISKVYVSFDGSYYMPNIGYSPYSGDTVFNNPQELTDTFGVLALEIPGYWAITDRSKNITISYAATGGCYKSKTNLVTRRPSNIYKPGLGKKYNISIRNDKSIYMSGNYVYDFGTRKFRIGAIHDVNLIEDLAAKRSGSLSNLLEFAKNDDGLFNTIYYTSNVLQAPKYDMEVEKNALYYMYVYSDDYYDSDDVYVLQGTDENIPLLTTTVDYSKIVGGSHNAVDPDTVDDQDDDQETNVDNKNDDTSNHEDVKNDDKVVDTGTVDNPGTGLVISVGLIVMLMFILCLSKFNKKKIYKI